RVHCDRAVPVAGGAVAGAGGGRLGGRGIERGGDVARGDGAPGVDHGAGSGVDRVDGGGGDVVVAAGAWPADQAHRNLVVRLHQTDAADAVHRIIVYADD